MEAAPSSSASAAPADIAFFSVASDRNRIATVVDGLRSRDVQVWWDADSRPRLVDTAPTSLRRAASHRRLVPLRVEPIERSLRRQYVGRPGSRAAGAPDPFSPQDCLEKIFQIPYALAPIDQTASAAGNGESPAPGDGAGQAGQLMVEADEQTDPDAGRKTDEPARGMEAALFFEDHEESFIQLLYAFIDRPRLAKRFVNIYRLLRVRADDENESATFAAERDSSAYRAALTLLAIQVGHARIAAKLGAAIERRTPPNCWAFVKISPAVAVCRPRVQKTNAPRCAPCSTS